MFRKSRKSKARFRYDFGHLKMGVEGTLTAKIPKGDILAAAAKVFVNETHSRVSKVWPIMVDKKMQFSNSVVLQKGMEGR